MKFIAANPHQPRRFSLPLFGGGLNLRDDPAAAADDQLTDADNVWCQGGSLRLRPGLRCPAGQMQPEVPDKTVEFCREDTADETAVGTRYGRRFVEREEDAGTVAFRTGILYCDGQTVYDPGYVGCSADEGDSALPVEHAPDATVRRMMLVSSGHLYAHTGTGWTLADDRAYVPLVMADGRGTNMTARVPARTSAPEQRNLLTSRFRARFTTDELGEYFHLPYIGLSAAPITATWVDGEGVSHLHVIPADAESEPPTPLPADGYRMWCGRSEGIVYFTNQGGSVETLPYGATENNLEITAAKPDPAARAVFGCRFGCFFGGNSALLDSGMRLFLSGNADRPSRIYWSAAGDPLYFPSGNYCDVGADDQPVTAFGRQDNLLVIFKTHEVFGVTSAASTAYTDGRGERLTLRQYHTTIGCDCPHTVRLCGGRLVWACSSGRVYMLTGTNAYARCNVRRLSALIEPDLQTVTAADWAHASACVFRGHYLLAAGHRAWLLHADESAFYRYTYAYSDEKAQKQLCWTRWSWDEDLTAVLALSREDAAALVARKDFSAVTYRMVCTFGGTADTVYTAPTHPTEQPVSGYFVTKPFDFGAPTRRKAIQCLRLAAACGEDGTVAWSMASEGGTASFGEADTYNGVITLYPPRRKNEWLSLRADAVGEMAVRDLECVWRPLK